MCPATPPPLRFPQTLGQRRAAPKPSQLPARASARGTGKRPASERDASQGAVSARPRGTRAPPPHARRPRPRLRTRARRAPQCSARCPWREASKLILSEAKTAGDTWRGSFSPCRDVVCVLRDVGTARGFRSGPAGGGSPPPGGRKRKGRGRRGRTGLAPGTQEGHVSSRETDFRGSQHAAKTACTPEF